MNSFVSKQQKIMVGLFFVFFVVLTGQPVAAVDLEPMAQVRLSVDEIFQILQDEQLQSPEMREERRRRVEAVVDEVFDFAEMAKSSLARYWKKRTPEERAYFVDLYADLVKQRYIGKIDAYSGQEVQYRDQNIKEDRAIVKTVLLDKSTEIPIDYILIKRGDRWLAFDMRIENISLVVNYRSDFASIIEKEKYSGLIKRMEKKVGKIKNLGAI